MELEQFLNKIGQENLIGIDSEYSYATKLLVMKFNANGAHLNRWWVMTPVTWQCPACKRSKSEIVRLNKNGSLMCQLHEHHDHMKDVLKELFEHFSIRRNKIVADTYSERFIKKTAHSLAAYDNTVICSDCNKADKDAKEIVGAHKYFSFSPNEIQAFVIPNINAEHEIDMTKAKSVWLAVKPTFELRMDMAKQFAQVATNKQDWYQPAERPAHHTEQIARHWFDKHGLTKIDKDEPEKLLYRTVVTTGSNSSWRFKKRKVTRNKPTDNQIEHLSATRGQYWNRYDDNWQCICCERAKLDCIRPSKTTPWIFEVKGVSLFSPDKPSHECDTKMCVDCCDTSLNLGREVEKESNTKISYPSFIIKLDELKKLIKSTSNSHHTYDNEYINSILSSLIIRAQEIYRKENIKSQL